ncbi:hypothetical protein [Flavobacterium ginsenosidimutans]|uniref:hypothetical protein n=1 Tax=Flavobacterium ginsenosidimutans TaxID=687844 RepID=UPI000DAE9F17|nr:hypothetical protein [Flavobacterium ginsenosidimutans]KAF2329613.1 hypothetical protein DM444_15315 [Flavobacterium ginsenosidimutans]
MEINHKITAQTKQYKLLLALYAVIGTAFLFGCQNKEDKKEKIENIEAIADTSTTKSVSLDKTPTDTKKSNQTAPSLSKAEEIEFKKATPITQEEVKEDKTSKSEKTKKDDASIAPKAPLNSNAEFPGGIEQFHNFFMKEYKKPEDVSYWKLNFTLAFAVEKNGTISFLECSPAVEEPLQKEIIRVLNLCPKWQPGESNGKKIRMQYSVPILLK